MRIRACRADSGQDRRIPAGARAVAAALLAWAGIAAGPAHATAWVTWTGPADGTAYPPGTLVAPSGRAGASGTVDGLDLMLLFDTSGSMGTNMALTRDAAARLVNALASRAAARVHVGVSTFDSAARVKLFPVPLDTQKNDVLTKISGILARPASTRIEKGMRIVEAALNLGRARGSKRKQVGLVLSDGYFADSGHGAAHASTAWSLYGISWYAAGIPYMTPGGVRTTELEDLAASGHGLYRQVVRHDPVARTYVLDTAALDALADALVAEAVADVALHRVTVTYPDGTSDFAPPPAPDGTFTLPPRPLAPGANVYTLHAWGTDGSQASATLRLHGAAGAPGGGGTVPAPAPLALIAAGLAVLALLRSLPPRRRRLP